MKKYMNIIRSNIWFIDVIFSLILGFAFVASKDYLLEGNYNINLKRIIQSLLLTVLFIILASLSRLLISKFAKENLEEERFSKLFKIKKHTMIKIAGIIFISWFPLLCMLFPGTCINDTWGQLQSVINLKNGVWDISSHHPIFDTFFMSLIMLPIVYKTGKWHIAMFVYVIIQAIATSLAFSYSLTYAKNKLKLNNVVLLIFLLIYCLLPIFPLSVQTISKDALFSWIYVLFCIEFIEIIRTKGKCLNNKKFIIKFFIIILLCSFAKKVGTYVVLGCLFVILISLHKYWKRISATIVIFITIMFVIIPNMYKVFNIKPSGKQEMYSLLFQQTARYVKYNSEDVTEDEKNVINKVLKYDSLAESYNPTNADYVKGYSQRGENSDYTEYLKVWIKQGIRKPNDYIYAMNSMLAGWFSFSEYKPLTNMDWHNQLNAKLIPDWVPVRENLFQKTSNIVNSFYDFLYKIPVIKVLLSYGFYASLLPAFVVATLLKRKKYNSLNWIVFVPLILSIVMGNWLAPVSVHLEGMRYLYPVIYSLPITLMWCIYSSRDSSNNITGIQNNNE